MLFAYTARLIKKSKDICFCHDCCKGLTPKEDMYKKFFEYIHGLGIETTVFYEPDIQRVGHWHVHGTLNIPNHIFRKKLIKDVIGMGYYFYLRYINNQQGWEEYIRKNQK